MSAQLNIYSPSQTVSLKCCIRPFFVGLVKWRKNIFSRRSMNSGVLCSVDIVIIIFSMCTCFSRIQHLLMNSMVDIMHIPLPNDGAGTATAPPLITSDHQYCLSHHAILVLTSIVRQCLLLSFRLSVFMVMVSCILLHA